jgi:hypothetical protein
MVYLAAEEGEVIHLERDYFWAISPDDLYNPLEDPRELTLGQLWHSWEFIENLPNEPDDAISHHLVWLADIIRALGHPQTREELPQ